MTIYRPLYTPFFRAIPVDIQEDNGESKEYHCLADERGYVYPKEVVQHLLEQVKDFYEREDATEMLIDHNKVKELEDISRMERSKFSQNESGKFILPPADYKYKVFKTDKRHWSITCGWCGEKVSSKDEEGYYFINNTRFNLSIEYACSEDCSKLIWKEGVKNWIHENGYQKFFVFE